MIKTRRGDGSVLPRNVNDRLSCVSSIVVVAAKHSRMHGKVSCTYQIPIQCSKLMYIHTKIVELTKRDSS